MAYATVQKLKAFFISNLYEIMKNYFHAYLNIYKK